MTRLQLTSGQKGMPAVLDSTTGFAYGHFGQCGQCATMVIALAANVVNNMAAITYSFLMASSVSRIRQTFNQTTQLPGTKAGKNGS